MVSTVVKATTALVAAAGLASAALPPLTHKGQFLFDSATGQRFNIKGVAYATTYGTTQANKPSDDLMQRDALANVEGCRRDVPYMKQLGVNVIRVYQIKADADHSACMQLLDDAGIYVLADLATHLDAISGDAPRWNLDLMQHYLETIVELGQYSNTMGFLVGNEVLNGPADTKAAPYLKAAIRDVKAWMGAHGYGQIVGYAATDKPESRAVMPHYLACADPDGGVTSSTVADFWGINLYEWCGQTTYETSGYRERTDELVDTGLISLMTENGCGTSGNRNFDDMPVIFSPAMDYVWSGSIAFEFFNQGNNLGINVLSADGSTLTPTADFGKYQAQLAAVQPSTMTLSSYSPNVTLPLQTCPTPDAAGFPVALKLPPTPNNDLCECAVAASSCAVSATISPADLVTAFDTVCGLDQEVCAQIAGDGTMTSGGVYGAYSMCAPQQQLAIVMGAYQAAHSGATCEFGGLGAAQTPSTTAAQCASKAFKNGVGVPTPSATISGAPAPTGGSGNGGNNNNNNGTDPTKGDGASTTVPSLLLALGALAVSLVFA